MSRQDANAALPFPLFCRAQTPPISTKIYARYEQDPFGPDAQLAFFKSLKDILVDVPENAEGDLGRRGR